MSLEGLVCPAAGARRSMPAMRDRQRMRPTRPAALAAAIVCSLACAHSKGSPAASQLCVVRHAQAFSNLEPRPKGLSDTDLDALTPHGEAQAQTLAERLPEGPVAVWSSPRTRTRRTAAALGQPVTVDANLRPLDEDETAENARARARALLAGLRRETPAGTHAVVVTHSDLGPIVLGETVGTPPSERAQRHALATAEVACVPLTPR